MIIISYAESNDRWIRSNSTSYSSALAGSNLVVNEDSLGVFGQTYTSTSNNRFIRQYFVEFQYAISAGQQPVSGFWSVKNNVTHGTNVNRNMEVVEYDWGGTVTTGNWRTPSQLNALERRGDLQRSNDFPNTSWTYTGVRQILDHVFADGTKRYVIVSSRNRNQNSPSQVEYNSVMSSRTSNPDDRPHLVVGTTTENAMTALVAAQIQLSDGSWIVVERTNLTREFQLRVIRRTLTTDTVIWESGVSSDLLTTDNILGSHSYSLCRDKNDNFFMVDSSWSRTDGVNVHPFQKGSGDTWTLLPIRFVALPEEDGQANIQATACAWHDVGSNGRLMVFAVTDWGRVINGSQASWALLNAGVLFGGSGTLRLDSGKMGDNGIIASPSPAGRNSAVNGTGTLFDAQADFNDTESSSLNAHSGYLVCGERSSILGQTGALSIGHYRIHSNTETLNSFTNSIMDDSGGFGVYDPDSKARVVPVADRRITKITADDRSEWGITLDTFDVSPLSSNLIKTSTIRLDEESVPDLPDGGAIGATSLWDAVYFSPDNNIWVYYFDAADDRRLLRTAVSMSDELAVQNSVEVNAAVGASGDEIHAIRVQRNRLVTDEVLITVAREDSGGDHHYEYLFDRINVPPTQPSLDAVSNFDADVDKELAWTFNDLNLNDEQTAYQLQVIRVSDSGTEFDTGKVSSSSNESHTLTGGSISNNDDYTWRVRTWDVDDAQSPWSDQGSFSTSNTGVVDITDPAVDNQDEIFTIDYLVKWDLSGASQEEYRLRLIRVSDSSVHTDTDWVESTVQEHLVTGMLSDIEYEIQVTTRDSLVESNTATRLITTHYSTPEQPIIALDVSTDREYVRISVENPEPRGDRPNPTVNQIYRRPLNSNDQYLLVGSTDPNSSFRDYTVNSGLQFEYKARAGVSLSFTANTASN